MIYIVLGALLIFGLFAAGSVVFARDFGWRETVGMWVFILTVLSVVLGASFLITYGMSTVAS
jgi:hypothetical protein